jgi:hypothetical protein
VLLTSSGFSVCVDKADGQRMRREFTLQGNSVRFSSEQACEAPPPPIEVKQAPLPVVEGAAEAPKEGFLDGLKRRWKAWRKK